MKPLRVPLPDCLFHILRYYVKYAYCQDNAFFEDGPKDESMIGKRIDAGPAYRAAVSSNSTEVISLRALRGRSSVVAAKPSGLHRYLEARSWR